MVRASLACAGVLLAGTAALFLVPFALDPWNEHARTLELALLAATLAGFVAVARRTLERPYLRRQVVVAAAAAPFAMVLMLAAVLFGLDLAGAHCPRSGMDYISECNDLASASMIVFIVGIYVVGMLLVIALAVLLAAGVKRRLATRRTAGSAPAAGGSR